VREPDLTCWATPVDLGYWRLHPLVEDVQASEINERGLVRLKFWLPSTRYARPFQRPVGLWDARPERPFDIECGDETLATDRGFWLLCPWLEYIETIEDRTNNLGDFWGVRLWIRGLPPRA
jgi:hypothetical protein